MQDIASEVDQSASAPDQGGSDWNLRLKYINRRQQSWAETYDWQCLYKEYNSLSTGTSMPTISLPSDYRKMAGYPKIATIGGLANTEIPLVDPQERTQYETTDKIGWVSGDPNRYIFGIPLTLATFASGSSVFIPYFYTPSSLVSPADVSPIPDPEYLVQGAIADLYKAREDPRFPSANQDAERILARMLENENTKGIAYNDRIKTTDETRTGFVIGRDQ